MTDSERQQYQLYMQAREVALRKLQGQRVFQGWAAQTQQVFFDAEQTATDLWDGFIAKLNKGE